MLRRLCLLLGLVSAAGLPASGAPVRSRILVPSKGAYELVLPPALHRQAVGGGLDLVLLGPDGQPRAFELYWGGAGAERQADLQASSYRLQGRDMVWESPLPGGEAVAAVTVAAAEDGFSGRLKVDLVGGPGAKTLARDQALFSGQPFHQDFSGVGEAKRLRLTLSGMDERFRSRASQIGQVTVTLRTTGRPASLERLELKAVGGTLAGVDAGLEEWRAALPGSGIFLESVEARTKQALLGSWRLGQERLLDGRPAFSAKASGQLDELSPQARTLVLPVAAPWELKDLRLRFDGRGRPVGLNGLSAELRLPRLAFDADQAGLWVLVAGAGGEAVQVAQQLGRPEAAVLVLGPAVEDASWKPAQAAARFSTQGGPFDPDGYRWSAALQVPGPGFWRVSLPLRAALDGPADGLRLVRDGRQVPFYLLEAPERGLSLTAKESFDAKANRSQWTLALPASSAAWKRIELQAHGVFERPLRLDWRRPGSAQWNSAGAWTWTHGAAGPDRFSIGAGDWTREEAELRLTMDHGDNRALPLDAVTAYYGVEDLAFVDGQGGPLQLWGGNPKATAPRYDLDLQRDGLDGLQAGPLQTGDLVPAKVAWWPRLFNGAPSGQAWFYLALGAVTLGLLVLIAKLLPRVG